MFIEEKKVPQKIGIELSKTKVNVQAIVKHYYS